MSGQQVVDRGAQFDIPRAQLVEPRSAVGWLPVARVLKNRLDLLPARLVQQPSFHGAEL